MNYTKTKKFSRFHINADVPVSISGAPGIGKSALALDIAADMAAEQGRVLQTERAGPVDPGAVFGFVDLRLATVDPVDLRGLPQAHNGRVRTLQSEILPHADLDGDAGLLFLDEINAVNSKATINAALQLVRERRLGDYRLPDGWRIMAACNKREHGAAVVEMSTAILNRFAHLTMDADVESWSAWAAAEGLHPDVRLFISHRPDALFQFDAQSASDAQPTPRTWEYLARVLEHADDDNDALDLAEQLVGPGMAIEFAAFVRLKDSLVHPQAALMDPKNVTLPADTAPDAMYALVSGVTRLASRDNMDRVLALAARMPRAFEALLIKDVTSTKPETTKTTGFIDWLTDDRNAALIG